MLTFAQFQKIYVINLPSRVDHRDAAVLAAAFTGLEIEYVDGVTHVDINMLPPGGKESEMSQAALGAIRAHLNVARLYVTSPSCCRTRTHTTSC